MKMTLMMKLMVVDGNADDNDDDDDVKDHDGNDNH